MTGKPGVTLSRFNRPARVCKRDRMFEEQSAEIGKLTLGYLPQLHMTVPEPANA